MEGELQDWEVLQSSGSSAEDNSESFKDGAQGMVSFDYFSPQNNIGVSRVEAVDDRSEDESAQSGSPGWIEPLSDASYGRKHISELWSDSSSDRIEDRRSVDFDVNSDFSGNMDLMNSGIKDEGTDSVSGVNLEREDELSLSDELISGNDSLEHVKVGEGNICEGKSLFNDSSVDSYGGGEERGLVWWKIPLEVFKFCVFKVKPVWSISMAAAVVGFVILGRRLYNMKKKSRTLQLKVLLDDKKVSKLANHAARVNEATPVMKRLPIIRPALPSPARMNQWPMMSLR